MKKVLVQLCKAKQLWCFSYFSLDCMFFSFFIQLYPTFKTNPIIFISFDLFLFKKLSYKQELQAKREINHLFCFEKVKHPIIYPSSLINFFISPRTTLNATTCMFGASFFEIVWVQRLDFYHFQYFHKI